MSNECSHCRNKIDDFTPENPADAIKFHQWLTNDKIEKVEILGTVTNTFSSQKKQLQVFLIHTYVKRKQAAHLDALISECDTKKVVHICITVAAEYWAMGRG